MVSPDDDFVHVAKLLVTDMLPRSVYVVDDKDRLLGTISYRRFSKRLLEYLNPALHLSDRPLAVASLLEVFENPGMATARSLMLPNARVLRRGDTLSKAIDALYAEDADELPVVDDDGRLMGVVRTSDLLREWVDDVRTQSGDDTDSWY
jgi:CBS-domain-containing membrane protein